MSLLGRAALFALREVARPVLEKTGEHLGNALGRKLGRKIDPTYEVEREEPDDKETKK